MKIDMRPFVADSSILLVFKSIDGSNPQWIIYDTDDEPKEESTIKIEFGRVVLSWLNQINPIKSDDIDTLETLLQLELFDGQLDRDILDKMEKTHWDAHYNNMTSFLMHKKIATMEALYDFFEKYKYFAHYFLSRQSFTENADVPKDCKKPSEILGYKKFGENFYQKIRVYGWTNLFVLDLWELLFNNKAKYKIKQCKNCMNFFRTSDKNRAYCVDCQSIVGDTYKVEYRNSPIHSFRKRILSKLGANAKYKNEAGDKLIEDFKEEFEYYKDIIMFGKSTKPKLSGYSNDVKTEADMIAWLERFEDSIRVYKKRDSTNGKTSDKD